MFEIVLVLLHGAQGHASDVLSTILLPLLVVIGLVAGVWMLLRRGGEGDT